MKNFYKFLIIVAVIIVSIFLVTFGFFSYILYTKYSYLFKIVRKMENDKYLWPVNKKISIGLTQYIKPKGKTLLIGVGNCGILDNLVKKLDQTTQIDVIDSNKYLLDLAEEKYGKRCKYINDNFLFSKLELDYENIVSSLPHKEYSLNEIDTIFSKYFNLSKESSSDNVIIYFENKMPHVKNSYVKMIINNKNKELDKTQWDLITKKNYKSFPPLNLCILQKKNKSL